MSEDTAPPTDDEATAEPVVLVVEDEPDLADLYAAWLGAEYEVRTAYGGEEALETLDEDVDAILLDRRMPGLSGDEVLVAVRERGVDCRVAMVTAVEPDFDIVAMGFDDYLVKPVTRESLLETVDQLIERSAYDAKLQEFFAVSSKLGVLESEKGRAALEESEQYRELRERAAELRGELDEEIATLGAEDGFEQAFKDLSRGEEIEGDGDDEDGGGADDWDEDDWEDL